MKKVSLLVLTLGFSIAASHATLAYVTSGTAGGNPVHASISSGSASTLTIASAYVTGGSQAKYLTVGPAGSGSVNGSFKNDPFAPTQQTYSSVLSDSSYQESTIPRAVISSVPEPTTVIAGALLLLPMGLQAYRRYRHLRKAITE